MYNCIKDTYPATYAGLRWNGTPVILFTARCGAAKNAETHFAPKCFIDRHGRKEYMKMMQDSDLIYCPACYEEVQKND